MIPDENANNISDNVTSGDANNENTKKSPTMWKWLSISFLLLSVVCIFLPTSRIGRMDGYFHRYEFVEIEEMPEDVSTVCDWARRVISLSANDITLPDGTVITINNQDFWNRIHDLTDEQIIELLSLYEAPFSEQEYLASLLRMRAHLQRGTFNLVQRFQYALDESRFLTLNPVFTNNRGKGYFYSNIAPYYEDRIDLSGFSVFRDFFKRIAILGSGFLITCLLVWMNFRVAPLPYVFAIILFLSEGGFYTPSRLITTPFEFFETTTSVVNVFHICVVLFIVLWTVYCIRHKSELVSIRRIGIFGILKLLLIIPIILIANLIAGYTPSIGKTFELIDEQGIRYCIHEERATVIGVNRQELTEGQVITIPTEIEGYPIISIANADFGIDYSNYKDPEMKHVAKVVIPDSVNVIWEKALKSSYEIAYDIGEHVLIMKDGIYLWE